MRDFNRGGSSRDGGFRRPSNGGFGRDSRGSDREMFDAVCDECGKNCKLPFRPTAGKPVYCSECFEQRGGGERNRSNDRAPERRDDRSSFGSKPSCDCGPKIEALNNKLDKILDLLNSMKSGKSKVEKKEEIEETVVFEKVKEDKKAKTVKKSPAKKAATKKSSKK